MPEYRVRWEIDIEADTPQEAACKARVSATKEDTTATVFEVEERLTVGRAEARGEFDVRWTPSFPHCTAYTIEEADALDEEIVYSSAQDACDDVDSLDIGDTFYVGDINSLPLRRYTLAEAGGKRIGVAE